MRPKPETDDVAKLALGPRKIERLRLGLPFDAWEAILAEITVGDVFGADRMDYLLRDSLHTGVAYGRFDHNRLIDTLRVMPRPPQERAGAVSATSRESRGASSMRYFSFAGKVKMATIAIQWLTSTDERLLASCRS